MDPDQPDKDEDEEWLSAEQCTIATRAANEGIPLGAIARFLQQPFERVAKAVRVAISIGAIGALPRADWPPSQKWDARMPCAPRTANMDDVEFGVRQVFKLTSLEVGFLMVLLQRQCADKEKLHGIIEAQRAARGTRPDAQEMTDPKMVDVMICKLRKKLRDQNPLLKDAIKTSWGKGYFIEQLMKDAIILAAGAVNAYGPEDQRAPAAAVSA